MIHIGSVTWPGPVGIAAGLIKGTAAFLDFGTKADSVEIGSITREPLRGNDGQTIWRYPEEKGLRHHAGMPNPGSSEIVAQLKDAQYQIKIPWGINIATTPGLTDTAQAVEDIAATATTIFSGGLHPHWLTLNVSSPDTVDPVSLLSDPVRVEALIQAVKPIASAQRQPTPLWLKLGAGLPDEVYDKLAQIALAKQVNAVIVSNAMTDPRGEPGGWCGRPLRAHTVALVSLLKRLTNGQIPLVAVGGIITGRDVQAALKAGATAVQVASALLIRGRTAALDLHREWELIQTNT
jgi:dihydroorotate dehydrogenase